MKKLNEIYVNFLIKINKRKKEKKNTLSIVIGEVI